MLNTTPPLTAAQRPAGLSAALDPFPCTPERLLFASADLDEIRSMVGRVMKPHRLALVGGADRLDARMHYTPLGDISLSRLRYGAAVEIEPGPLDSFFLVQMPISGSAEVESGAQHIDSGPDVASVLSPEEGTKMRWSAGNEQLMLRLSRSLVERTLVGHFGHPLEQPLRFELGFEWRGCAQWRCLLNYLIDCSTQGLDLAQHKLVIAQIEQLAASVLLASHQHNYSEAAPSRRGRSCRATSGARRTICRPMPTSPSAQTSWPRS